MDPKNMQKMMKQMGIKSEELEASKVTIELKEGGRLEKEEPYKHSVNKCYRCGQHIEPLVSEQWFVKMKDLAAPAITAAEKEEVKFFSSEYPFD